MQNSPRPFHLLNDVADRWSVPAIDVVDWAIEGLLVVSIAVSPTRVASSAVLSGLVEVAGTDVRSLFLPTGAKPETVAIRRIREHGATEWQWIGAAPTDGLLITAADILIRDSEVERLRHRFLLDSDTGTPRSQSFGRPGRTRPAGPGAPPRHNWDQFFVELTRRIYVNGLPRSQSQLVRDMADWFHTREHPPDESTIRRKVALVWRELMRACVLPIIAGSLKFVADCAPVLL